MLARIHIIAKTTIGLALCLASYCAAASAVPETFRFKAPTRVVAFGDVHGAYEPLIRTLRAAGVVDAQGRWSGGAAHLVSVGDLIDRGPDSRKVLDLLMRLEGEAAAAGGHVHVLLGNHEVMNLSGELRDASTAEFAAFIADETSAERATALESWLASHARGGDGDALRAEFEKRFPPGWFAHRREFARDGRYGRWLLAHPVAIVVGDTAFAHGGFSRGLAGYDLDRLNAEFRAGLLAYLDAVGTLERAGWLEFSMPGETWPTVLAARRKVADATVDPVLAAAARAVSGFDSAPLFGLRGPVWYRGLALCHSATEQDVADAARAQFGVSRLAVGHTPTPKLRPTTRLGASVLMLDAGMLKSVYGGRGYAVQIDAAGIVAIAEDGVRSTLLADDRHVGLRLPGGSDAVLEKVLLAAKVATRAPLDGEREALTLDDKGTALQAWFFPDRKGGGSHLRELVAYRLDRLLGLGLVPTTVEREIEGVRGALQWHPDRIVGAAATAAGATGGTPWCDTSAEIELLYVWDALVLNQRRAAATLDWSADDWLLLASDHRSAFGTGPGPPAHLKGRKLQIGAELCRRLASLDANSVRAAVKDGLGDSEQAALLKRRSRIFKQASCGLTPSGH